MENSKIGTLDLNTIHQGDCLELLKSLPDNSIDLVITSPPYNLKGLKTTNGKKARMNREAEWWDSIDYDGYDDNMPEPLYEKWQIELLDEIYRVLKESGSCMYNHKDRPINGTIVSPLTWLQHSKMNLRQIIVWDRKTSTNKSDNFFIPSTEYIYWLTKSTKNVRFERQPYLVKKGEQKGEYIHLPAVWTVSPETKKYKFTWEGKEYTHPAPYNLELIERIIPSFLGSKKMQDELGNLVVLDPFMGSGTTALGAIKYGCDWIGFEQSAKYIAMANQRIDEFKATLE